MRAGWSRDILLLAFVFSVIVRSMVLPQAHSTNNRQVTTEMPRA
jgi:hypothetical protein